PAGEEIVARTSLLRWQEVWEITEAGVDVHLTVGIETCRVQRDPPLEVPVVADPRSARVPPVAEHVLESVAVSSAVNEPAGLVANRIVRCIGEGTERIAAGIDSRGVDVVFGAGGAVLQVVSPVVLR